MVKKVVVVDLDGTLLSTNTFHKWMIFLLKKTLKYNFIDGLKIIFFSFKRIFKRITHKQLKFEILKISEQSYYSDSIHTFVEELAIYINRKVLDHMETEDVISILATAAPEIYAETIAEKYHFTYCIATPKISQSEWYENIKEEKKKSLKKLLNKIGEREIDIVLSDHYDDIPIMNMANTVYLVNGSFETKQKLKETQINFIEL